MAEKEECFGCRYALMPWLVLLCSNPKSEFDTWPVLSDGWCPQFERDESALQSAGGK